MTFTIPIQYIVVPAVILIAGLAIWYICNKSASNLLIAQERDREAFDRQERDIRLRSDHDSLCSTVETVLPRLDKLAKFVDEQQAKRQSLEERVRETRSRMDQVVRSQAILIEDETKSAVDVLTNEMDDRIERVRMDVTKLQEYDNTAAAIEAEELAKMVGEEVEEQLTALEGSDSNSLDETLVDIQGRLSNLANSTIASDHSDRLEEEIECLRGRVRNLEEFPTEQENDSYTNDSYTLHPLSNFWNAVLARVRDDLAIRGSCLTINHVLGHLDGNGVPKELEYIYNIGGNRILDAEQILYVARKLTTPKTFAWHERRLQQTVVILTKKYGHLLESGTSETA